jgi:hypothetical protein
MVKVYAVALVVGLVGLLVVILGGALAENLGREDRDPGRRWGANGRTAIGALVGFGMGGLSVEFSALEATWQIGLLLALLGAVGGGLWGRFGARVPET